MVGANGAGKTTTLRTVAGLNHPLQGEILFQGRDISRLRAHQTLALGISYVPEGRRVFAKLSVEKNLSLWGLHGKIRQPKSSDAWKKCWNCSPCWANGHAKPPRR